MKDYFKGETFSGKYLLEKQIHTSPLFYVYKARHILLKKPVIVKILRIDIIKDESYIPILKEVAQEVLEELRRISSLEQHPNVNAILDIDKEKAGKVLYFVVDYYEEGLAERISRKGRLELYEAFRITEGILRGLEYVHSNGIAHKSLKPNNVRFKDKQDMNVVITDFGLGYVAMKAIRRLKLSGFLEPPIYVTPRLLKGTDYVSMFEADLYSVAGLLYYMITGHEPFEGDVAKINADKLANKVIPPSKYVSDLPKKVEEFILKGLEITGEGYRSAKDMLEALYSAFSNVESFVPAIVKEVRDEDKDIRREVFINEKLDVALEEIKLPSVVASGMDVEIIFRFNKGMDFEVEVFPKDILRSVSSTSSKKTYVLFLKTPIDFYGILEPKIQFRTDSSYLFKYPIALPVIVAPMQSAGNISEQEFGT